MFTVLIFGRNTQYLHMAKDLYDWQAKGFSEIYEHTDNGTDDYVRQDGDIPSDHSSLKDKVLGKDGE